MPVGAAGGLDLGDFSAVDNDLRAFGGMAAAFAGGEGEPADAGDARQGLAAKTHGGDGGQILGALDFAGGMPFQAEQRIIAAHAAAVIGHADKAPSAGLDFHGDIFGAGVEGIFDQFLHHAGGALNHFAGGDLVGDLFGKELDAVHVGTILRFNV